VYGKPSGVLGFRLFPNPDFNEEARKKWDGDRFINDSTYYNDNKLVRPYRVGVACGACHIAPYPDNPPADPEIRAGKISHRPLAISTSTKEKSSRVTSKKVASFMRCWRRSHAALPTLPGSRPITSTIQTQSTRSFCLPNGSG